MRRRSQKVWFFLVNHTVKGPFEIGKVPYRAEISIWREGFAEWKKTNFYEISTNPEMTQTEDYESDLFYVESDGYHIGPINSQKLINELNAQNLKAKIKLWTPGLKKWVSLFDFPELIKRWGLSRRKHRRVPLASVVSIQDSTGKEYDAESASLSAGGLGTLNFQGKVGNLYVLKIMSPALKKEIKIKAKCVHSQLLGSGFEFLRMKRDSFRLLQDYIQNFT